MNCRTKSRGRALGRSCSSSPRRWMVYGFCRLSGPWREVVRAETAAGALVKYSSDHDLPLDCCHVQPA